MNIQKIIIGLLICLIGFPTNLFAFCPCETQIGDFSDIKIIGTNKDIIFWGESGGGNNLSYGIFRYNSENDTWENIGDEITQQDKVYIKIKMKALDKWGAEYHVDMETIEKGEVTFIFFERENIDNYVEKKVTYPSNLWNGTSFKFFHTPSKIWFYHEMEEYFLRYFDKEKKLISGIHRIKYSVKKDLHIITYEMPDGKEFQHDISKFIDRNWGQFRFEIIRNCRRLTLVHIRRGRGGCLRYISDSRDRPWHKQVEYYR